MSRTVDYYYSLVSPWAYLGHAPFMAVAARHGLQVNHKPIFLGRVFAETGGLPLGKRHPARQRYRLVELQRWREKRGVSLNLHPKHWPFETALADRFVIAIVAAHGDPDPFLRRAFAGIWDEERNLADPLVVAELAEAAGLDSTTLLQAAGGDLTEALYALNLENAIEAGVFGSPAYVVDGEVFWGQDRIELLDDALSSGRGAYRPEVNPLPAPSRRPLGPPQDAGGERAGRGSLRKVSGAGEERGALPPHGGRRPVPPHPNPGSSRWRGPLAPGQPPLPALILRRPEGPSRRGGERGLTPPRSASRAIAPGAL